MPIAIITRLHLFIKKKILKKKTVAVQWHYGMQCDLYTYTKN